MSLNGLLTVGIKERYLSHWYFLSRDNSDKNKIKIIQKNLFLNTPYMILMNLENYFK